MSKCSLVIMAAGLGSRYGNGIKQLAAIGPNNEIIMDYSIHDAIEAGFDKIIFIIRRDIEDAFKDAIGNRIEKVCKELNVEVCYCYQDRADLPEGFEAPADRTKPWGTGHALYAARNAINEPFVVINADDYYGKSAWKSLHDYLVSGDSKYCMAGFILKNTLSDNGSVNRGVLKVDSDNNMLDVEEVKEIVKKDVRAFSGEREIPVDSYVSMNMWGLPKSFVDFLKEDFKTFLSNLKDPLKDEYYIGNCINKEITINNATVKVLPTYDSWLGVTYASDKEFVVNEMAKLYAKGVYQNDFFGDLK